MQFEIGFNNLSFNDDDFLIKELGAFWVLTNAAKYGPFDVLEIEVKDFKHLEEILEKVDKKYNSIYSAVISFDPPKIFLDNKV